MKAIAKNHFLKFIVILVSALGSSDLIAQCSTETIISSNSGSIFTTSVAISLGQSFTSPSETNPRQLQQISVFARARFGFGTTENRTVTVYEGEGLDGNLVYSETFNFRWPSNNQGESLTFPVDFSLTNGPNLNPGTVYSFYITDLGDGIRYSDSNPYNQGVLIGTSGATVSIADLAFEISTSPEIATPTITESGSILTSSIASAYQWMKDGVDINGATSQTLDVSNQEGNYRVRITDSNGCEGISEELTVDNKAPVFTSVDAVSVEEESGGTFYTATTATDASVPVTYSLANGVNDNVLFSISGAAISFITPPVFNIGGNNTYTLTVTATDASANSSTIDVTVTVFQPSEPPNGNCGTVLNFDGNNDHVNFGNFSSGLDNGSALTISYFYKGADLQSPIRIQSDDFFVAGWTGAGSQPAPLHILSWDGGTTTGILLGDVNDDKWHHVAVTWEQDAIGGFRSYLDGNLIDSRNAGNSSIPVLSNDIFNLASFQGFTEYLEGALDEVSIWNRALTQQEIQNIINNGLVGDESNLLHYYNFNELTGTTLTDLTGSLDGTLTNMDNADWTDINGNTVTLGSQTITNFDPISNTYGNADFNLSATSDAGTEVQGFVITYESSDESVATISGKTVTIVGVGTTTITATQAGGEINGSCYATTSASQSLTVNRAPLTISAADATIDYGDAIPATTISYSGFVNGDDETDLMGTLTFIDPPTNAAVAPYVNGIDPSGFTSDNYLITYERGDLTIDPAPLTIAANDVTLTYGDIFPSSPVTYVGFKNGEDETYLSGMLAFSTLPTDASNTVYTDAIVPSGFSSSNYDISYESANLTINPAILTVTANDQTITYGDGTGLFSVSYSGFVNAEDENTSDITGSVTFENLPTDASSSTYIDAIQPSGLTSNNYNITYERGNLFIGPAPLAATVNQSITFGDDIPDPFTVTYTGFLNGDDETVIDSPPFIFTSGGLSADSDAGSYPVNVIGGSDNNYEISSTNGTLIINQAPQTITFLLTPEQNRVETTMLTLAASGGTSGNSVTYTSSNTSVAVVSGNTLTLVSAGVTTITANQAGTTNYEAATPVAQALTIVEEYIWDGASWNSGDTPPTDVNIMIEDDFTVSEDGTFEAANLEVVENVTVTIDNENAIVVNSELLLDGNISINSGGILALYGNATVTGELTASRNVTAELGYSTVGTTVGDISVASLSVAPDFFYGFDGTNFTIPTMLEAGKGYFVAYDAPNPLFTIEGVPNTGEIDVSLTYSDDGDATNDFSLIANSYNAAISRQSFVDNNTNIDGVTYYWQDGGANLPNGSRDGTYVTVTADGTTTGGTFDGNIRSGQGFFVRATSSGTVNFDPMDQITDLTSNTDGGFFRTTSSQKIRLSVTDGTSRDEAVISFDGRGSTSLDQGLDACKFMNPSLSLYTLAEKTPLAIQALPMISESIQIPLGYQVLELGEIQMSVDFTELDETLNVYLIDQLAQTKVDLRTNPIVTLTLTESSTNDRFALEISSKVLHVEEDITSDLIVYGTIDQLNICANISGNHEVYIYGLDGKRMHTQTVRFESGNGTLHPKLSPATLYILQVDGSTTKFIIRD